MRLIDLIPKRWRMPATNLKKLTGRLVVAHWDREAVYYLVSAIKGNHLSAQAYGTIPCDQKTPLAALAERLRESSINVQYLAILLSRPELEQATLTLPPSSDDELPVVVIGSMEQQLGDAETPPSVDFLRLAARGTSSSTIEVQAFALSQKMIDSLQQEAQQAGFKLVGIGSRQLAALSMMRNVQEVEANLNINIQVYPGEIELTLCEATQPRILRSIRVSQDEPQEWTELILREVQRCVTMLPPEVEDLKSSWLVNCNCDEARAIADALSKDPGRNVVRLEPLADWAVDRTLIAGANEAVAQSTAESGAVGNGRQGSLPSGALVGASWELWNDCLSINLLVPKRPPKPPNPYLKPAIWTSVAAVAMSTIGYALKTDVWKLEAEVQKLQTDVQASNKLSAKMQEKSDQTIWVENWLTDQVDWLHVLGEISNRMPDGQDATVGRLTASANGKQGVIDLSVQVADPEKISQLESKLRSVKYAVNSKRISQSPEASEYPWRFETRILFEIEPADWNSVVPPQPTQKPQVEPKVIREEKSDFAGGGRQAKKSEKTSENSTRTASGSENETSVESSAQTEEGQP